MDENALVQLAREGSQEAFRNLFDANKQKVFALAFRYSRNREDAEDILQETFIKAFHSLDKFNAHKGNSFSSWLFRISINSSIDLLRKNKKMNNKNHDSKYLENLSSQDLQCPVEDIFRTQGDSGRYSLVRIDGNENRAGYLRSGGPAEK